MLEALVHGAFRLGIIKGAPPSPEVLDKIAHEMIVICDRDEDGEISMTEVGMITQRRVLAHDSERST